MSSNRKLSEAIDKNLKKVSEGVDAFDDLWDKFYSASTPGHKEKFEAELKREIKKLQRLRDDIKRWLSSSDIKDKSQLLDARKLIESKMESFKVCEREAKTKAYSKEGLQAQSKLDPATAARMETENWINDAIEKLELQIETVEADLELAAGKKGKSAQEQMERLEHLLDSHRTHIDKLETILRLLSNDEITVDEISSIKEGVEYYVDSNQDPDFMEDEYLYDDILADRAAAIEEHIVSHIRGDAHERSSQGDSETSNASEQKTQTVPTQPPTANAAAAKQQQQKKEELDRKADIKSTPAAAAAQPAPAPQALPAKDATKPKAPTSGSTAGPSSTTSSASSTSASAPVASAPASVSSVPQAAPTPTPAPTPAPAPVPTAASGAPAAATAKPFHEVVKKTALKEKERTSPKPNTTPNGVVPVVPPQPPLNDVPQPASSAPAPVAASGVAQDRSDVVHKQPEASQRAMNASAYPKDEVLLLLETSLRHLPGREVLASNAEDKASKESQQDYVPMFPYVVPESFPQQPLQELTDPALFEKFDVDTLFFIFYYQQGTYAQYLAAKELKRQSWRFHKKYLTWFQRHNEPKVVTDEYEQGTYVYFDYETGWVQRIKSEFTFEYAYLENDLV